MLLNTLLDPIKARTEESMTEFPYRMYRVRRHGYKAWEIRKKTVVKKGKNKGKEIWVAFKYPGNMLQTVQGLLDLAIPTSVSFGNAYELIEAIEKAEKTVMEMLETMQKEKDN